MKLFNAIQLVTAFVACPFLIDWLSHARFRGADAACFVVCTLYVAGFCVMVAAVAGLMEHR